MCSNVLTGERRFQAERTDIVRSTVMNTVRSLSLDEDGLTVAFAFRCDRDARRKQRADLRPRVLMPPAPNAAQFEVLVCLPTAPVLPTGGNGDFGTSPFYGQLSDKPLLILISTWGAGRKAQYPPTAI